MRKNILISLQIATVLVVFFLPTLVSCAAHHKNIPVEEKKYETGQVGFNIKLDKKAYNIGEPIRAECELTNELQETLYLHPSLFGKFDFYLKYPDGEVVPFGRFVSFSEIWEKEDVIKLLPKESYNYKSLFRDDVYTMPNRVGKYEIYGIYGNKTESLFGINFWTGAVKSNTETFEIYK